VKAASICARSRGRHEQTLQRSSAGSYAALSNPATDAASRAMRPFGRLDSSAGARCRRPIRSAEYVAPPPLVTPFNALHRSGG
jgi:hypothetical protein